VKEHNKKVKQEAVAYYDLRDPEGGGHLLSKRVMARIYLHNLRALLP
jgi:hypothetical protein